MVRDKVSWDPPSGNESIRGSVCPRGNSAPRTPSPYHLHRLEHQGTALDRWRRAGTSSILRCCPPPPPAASGLRTAPDRRPRAGRRTPRTRLPRTAAAPKRLRAVMRRFLRCECASVALESAIALSVLVSRLLGPDAHRRRRLLADDRTGRGARAVARTMALNPSADPWAALKREGGLSASATCPAVDRHRQHLRRVDPED